jgi:hypothetical protein
MLFRRRNRQGNRQGNREGNRQGNREGCRCSQSPRSNTLCTFLLGRVGR